MGQFLRDQRLRNLNIDEATLDGLNTVLMAQVAAKNAPLLPLQPQQPVAGAPVAASAPATAGAPAAQGQVNQALLNRIAIPYYVLRFDDKGYRFANFADVRKNYSEAKEVERVIFLVDSGENRWSGGLTGTQLELRLDAKDPNMCYLTVTADEMQWVETTFGAFMAVLSRQRNISGWIRTRWTGAAIQLIGICFGFVFSLWAAVTISPALSTENAFAIGLIFSLLIFSIVWGYLNEQIARLVDVVFPNVRFKRKGKEDFSWWVKGVFIGLTVAFSLYVIQQLLILVASILGSFFK